MTECAHIEAAAAVPWSPFSRMLITNYYDGPIEGFVECHTCGRLYAFRKLAWDEDQDLRIFGLAPLDDDYDTVCTLLGAQGDSKTAAIVPPLQGLPEKHAERLLATSMRYVVTAYRLNGELLAVRNFPQTEPVGGWIAWLGIS